MVKIDDVSLEERTLEEKQKTLMSIATEIMSDAKVTPLMGHSRMGLAIYDGAITVRTRENRVDVYNPNYSDQALKLAQAYEERMGAEFILVKHKASDSQ